MKILSKIMNKIKRYFNGRKIVVPNEQLNNIEHEEYVLDIHAFSVNKMYEALTDSTGKVIIDPYTGEQKKRCTKEYNEWKSKIDKEFAKANIQLKNIDLTKPLKIYVTFEALYTYDCDNLVKSFQDAFARNLKLSDDKNIQTIPEHIYIDDMNNGRIIFSVENREQKIKYTKDYGEPDWPEEIIMPTGPISSPKQQAYVETILQNEIVPCFNGNIYSKEDVDLFLDIWSPHYKKIVIPKDTRNILRYASIINDKRVLSMFKERFQIKSDALIKMKSDKRFIEQLKIDLRNHPNIERIFPNDFGYKEVKSIDKMF